jgi:SAM-dependent methyltransferase
MKETNSWNANRYKQHASFVSELALPVVALLDPKEGEKILDLGCGEGTLGLEIAKSGANVVAIDLSGAMVAKAQANGLEAQVMSATEMPFVEEFDAVFSNATLHWVKDSRLAIKNIAKALKTSGRFVAEFGGHGNVHRIINAMKEVFNRHPEYGKFDDFWYFPTPEEYSVLLEQYGFEVEYIELIPRPTPIDDIANWLAVFSNGITEHLDVEHTKQFRAEVREILKESIYSEQDGWVADYVRLRVKAIKRVTL